MELLVAEGGDCLHMQMLVCYNSVIAVLVFVVGVVVALLLVFIVVSSKHNHISNACLGLLRRLARSTAHNINGLDGWMDC